MATRSIPENAICVSLDEDNNYLYVGTAQHENHVVPGKIIPAKGVCYIAYAGGEHEKTEYEVVIINLVNFFAKFLYFLFSICALKNISGKCSTNVIIYRM